MFGCPSVNQQPMQFCIRAVLLTSVNMICNSLFAHLLGSNNFATTYGLYWLLDCHSKTEVVNKLRTEITVKEDQGVQAIQLLSPVSKLGGMPLKNKTGIELKLRAWNQTLKLGKEISNLTNKSDIEEQAATLTKCEFAGDCFKQRSRSTSELCIPKGPNRIQVRKLHEHFGFQRVHAHLVVLKVRKYQLSFRPGIGPEIFLLPKYRELDACGSKATDKRSNPCHML
ncbi:unnamed protein product [Sphenostylis stenocarpa]|uniref:Uncharacterized protein n=1 Tax=Sphenostylis stenocarpa TaxID=92480 RepID=A0AA86VN20_9FABA|nr:unnamed protein product [Sphenostylis stenocarpa]